MPVLFHLEAPEYRLVQQCKGPTEWAEWYGGEIGVVGNICAQCPKTTFIGHGPGFWREISGGAERKAEVYPSGPVRPGGQVTALMRKYRNLHADLSANSGANALRRDKAHARRFLAEFQDRVLFGRDQFDGSLMEVLSGLNLGEAVLEKVLRGNAEKLVPEKSARIGRPGMQKKNQQPRGQARK